MRTRAVPAAVSLALALVLSGCAGASDEPASGPAEPHGTAGTPAPGTSGSPPSGGTGSAAADGPGTASATDGPGVAPASEATTADGATPAEASGAVAAEKRWPLLAAERAVDRTDAAMDFSADGSRSSDSVRLAGLTMVAGRPLAGFSGGPAVAEDGATVGLTVGATQRNTAVRPIADALDVAEQVLAGVQTDTVVLGDL